jgi:hypothetical protein
MNFFSREMAKEREEFNLLKDRRKPKVKSIAKHQTGKSHKARDKARKALPPGKRRSRTGNIYYEYRKSRSDMPGEMI